MSDRSREPQHFAYIDAVRGFAILGVLVVHCAGLCGSFQGAKIAQEGGYGVQLFFLASAITLCFSMSTRREGRMDYINFYLRRLFRIAPLFWLAIAAYWTVPGIVPRAWLMNWAPDGVSTSYFLLTALFLHGWHPYTFNCIVPGGWSIAVEMTFYVVFPFCFHHITTLRKAALWMLGGCLFAVFIAHAFSHFRALVWPHAYDNNVVDFFQLYWFPRQFSVFLIGIFTYFLLQQSNHIYKSRYWPAGFVGLCAVTAFYLYKFGDGGFTFFLLIISILAVFIISLAGRTLPLMVNALSCNLGKISYSCYITHFAALSLVVRFFETIFPQYQSKSRLGTELFDGGSRVNNLGLFLLLLVMTLILTVLFSTVTYHLVENPGIALGKSVIRRINKRAPAIQVSDG